MKSKKKCFVIMPFSETDSLAEEKWTETFKHIIKPAVEESGLGYECNRYSLGRANIIKDILEDLNRAQVVIADLTDNNPNVLWELGVRHVLKRRTILISQDKKFLPSDLKDYPVIPYDQTKAGFDKFKEDIKEKLENIEVDPEKPDSPVADFLQLKNIDILAYEKSANLKKLCALISEMSRNLKVVDPILKNCQENQEARKKEEQTSVLSIRFENNCLTLLLANLYILLPKQLLERLSTLNSFIITTNSRLGLWASGSFGNSVEKSLISHLPLIKKGLEEFMRDTNKIRIDYINDNYQEIEAPLILLASPKHEEYLKITK